MGNQPMTIGLKVNTRGPHPAGSILYGKVYLSVSKKPQTARSIQLRVIGKEVLVVHHTTERDHHNHNNNRNQHHGSERHTEDHYEHSTHDILQMDYPIRVFPDGKIPIGQYEFPFALQLPENLPSTMSCRKGQSTCEVKFEIIAEVYQQPNSMFHTNPNAKEELVVEASTDISPLHDTSLALPAETIPVTGCCCSKKGSMSLETKFDKTTVQAHSTTLRQDNPDAVPRDAFSVDFRCQNRSTVSVEKVRAQLLETIEWTSNGYQEQLKTVLAKIEMDATQFPELEKLRKVDRRRLERRQYFGVGSNDMLTLQHQPWHTLGPIRVPRHAKDSYHGRAITIRHVLSLELITKGCCKSNPDASTLVQIYRRLADAKNMNNPEYEEQSFSAPSAPIEEEQSLAPSAPSEMYDFTMTSHSFTTNAAPAAASFASSDVFVEAQALPPDWNAQTADVVTIPMADAIILGPSVISPSAPTL
ncbi:arrestin or S-antigen, N-terminal domain containing protein [Nitzschia inconspicua]|uniref:Arrestin or S-antigen, N-terminal domain containing protein n=1 Tax=Nitzschia inconspicua TaxID=303405 RepID=A0A9K3Q877_9STRA|nr:arrestin or S-antigen, N-terminal domain containing protein [Nitzschia inconspicua]